MQTARKQDPQPLVAAVRGATKHYPGVLALDDVDFEIRRGEVRALLGKNGAGKSTLIRLLTGATVPDGGEVTIDGAALTGSGTQRTVEAARLGVRAVYQELSLIVGMSIAENLFLGRWPSSMGVLSHGEMDHQARETLARLGLKLDPRRRVATLSPAERQLVEIARVMIGEPKLVILDEPTSSLAAAEVELLFKAVRSLAAAGIAVIYVSHRMNEIRQIAQAATVMRDGKVAGTVEVAGADTAEIIRLMLGRSERDERLVGAARGGDAVLSVRDLAVPPKLSGVSFDLKRGEVLGFAGLLGSGRTELLRAIGGLDGVRAGTVLLDDKDITRASYGERVKSGIGMTPESRKEDGIVPLLGVDENTVATDFSKVTVNGVISASRMAEAAGDIIRRIGIKAARIDTPVGTLSGGNQQKVVIGRWVYAGSRILLLDEPTRGVDVEAKSQIYAIIRQLAAEGKSIIFVSSEIEELPKVCDRVLVLKDGNFVQEFAAPGIETDALMAACL
ncbi:sugar ABC transporter ATP-binding protein [Mesorhizobium sp. YC-39]|uniref:sugar ABC transporter ATP-binding protein n=1 Tax=unclassified Mesorhizobium TaxID=325217 RepID=UPI0021E7CE56|nr:MULTISPECIES: sugar ABC transporter ATP-binding protein [unclassified Mesorhizobium]MCV3208693.1 sugar ABC transporter ATP-binding protein [Mesorhizobium sp. YC-2]MCV3231958.1 sugar ABC transporter ATP-binding protein [Mesorhizobium sp. YC-39]